jgi:hypothetical protein
LDAVLSQTIPGPPPGAAAVVFEVDELEGVVAVLVGVDVVAGVEAVAGELVLEPVDGVVVVVLVDVEVVPVGLVELEAEGLEEVDVLVAPHHVFTPLWPTHAPILVDALE